MSQPLIDHVPVVAVVLSTLTDFSSRHDMPATRFSPTLLFTTASAALRWAARRMFPKVCRETHMQPAASVVRAVDVRQPQRLDLVRRQDHFLKLARGGSRGV
ncbi:MAG: hypothetical protein MZU91_14700 [Desulfosudis oleivorans]|nr:hypothetical protein [Desulfosudis oleivorans]